MTDPTHEPLFTIKGLLLGAALCSVYAVLLLSMDSQWVGWAAPLAFGGALVASGPPPVAVFSASPREVFEMASSMSLLSLLALGLLSVLRGERSVGWFARARQSLETRLLTLATLVLKGMRSLGSSMVERCYPLEAVLASYRKTAKRYLLKAACEFAASRAPEQRTVRRASRVGDQKAFQPLLRKTISAGSDNLHSGRRERFYVRSGKRPREVDLLIGKGSGDDPSHSEAR